AFVDGALDGARDLFTHDGTHAAADKTGLHGADVHAAAFQPAYAGEQSVFHRSRFLHGAEPVTVRFAVDEMERVGGCQIGILLFEFAAIEQHGKTRARVHAEVKSALA